jgi:hypothetical protein
VLEEHRRRVLELDDDLGHPLFGSRFPVRA